jgi:NitT/TauT family transport system ATP-binding protein
VKAVELEGVCRHFRSENGTLTTALEGVDMTIPAGGFASVIGPSGCGKSTLLGLISGTDRADAGVVRLGGHVVDSPSSETAMVFQEPALFPWLSVRGNVEYGLRARGVPKDKRRELSDWALSLVHLERFDGHRPHELSGGMRQRTAIARALALSPEVLLMDEPFAALDAQTRNVLEEELQQIYVKTTPTVLLVTHSLIEACFQSDVVFVMSARPGRIIARYDIDLPRPRQQGDPRLAELRAEMFGVLRAEVDRARAVEEAVAA